MKEKENKAKKNKQTYKSNNKKKSKPRNRRSQEQNKTPIDVTFEEFSAIVSLLNALYSNVVGFLHTKFEDSDIRYRKKPLSPLTENWPVDGANNITDTITVYADIVPYNMSNIMKDFAKQNRYLNISECEDLTDSYVIKLENSDKYPIFNISVTYFVLAVPCYRIDIYSRRYYKTERPKISFIRKLLKRY